GANNSANDRIAVAISKVSTTSGTLSPVGGVDVTTTSGAQSAITTLDTAISSLSTLRATLGAYQHRLEHTLAPLPVPLESPAAALAPAEQAPVAPVDEPSTEYEVHCDKDSHMYLVRLVAPQTKQVVVQVPPQQVLNLVSHLLEQQASKEKASA